MYLTRLEAEAVRVLRSVQLTPSERLNVLVGDNGAGKTSVLEAIHVLGTGRSFRGRDLDGLVQWGSDGLRVFGQVTQQGRGAVRLGVVRDRDRSTQVRVDGEDRRGFACAARVLPLAVFSPESQEVVAGQPERRRSLMDWALFHVEPAYGDSLQRYRRALRQRNLALRTGQGRRDARAWEPELQREAERLHEWRSRYVADIAPYVRGALQRLRDLPVELDYRPGWRLGRGLTAALEEVWELDSARGWTSVGPHAADVALRVRGRPAREVLSRGETRTVVAALVLAHVEYLRALAGRQPVVLADDVASELDGQARAWFVTELAALGAQVFLTAVDRALLPIPAATEHQLFHVKQGALITLL